jgi:porin
MLCGVLGAGIFLGPNATAADDYIAEPSADAEYPIEEEPQSTGDIWNRETMTGDWGGLRTRIEDFGVHFTPTFTLAFLGNPSGGMWQGNTVNGLFNLQLDIDLEKASSGLLGGLLFHVNALYAFGPDLSKDFVGDFSGISPIAAYNSIRLQELWLQKSFFDERLFIRFGNLAIDTDFFISSSSALYLNSTISTLVTSMAINVPNFPAYPVASPGVRVKFLPTPRTYVMAGFYGMDANSNSATNNKAGTRLALAPKSGFLFMSEIGYLLNQQPEDKGLHGTYRIGSYLHTGNYDTWQSQAENALGKGPLQSASPNFGIYGLLEQQVYANDAKSVSVFAGGGGAPTYIDFLAWTFECGVNFSGFIPGRDDDIAGVAFARSSVSGAFSDSMVTLGCPSFTSQCVLEATYRIQVTPWWYVQPDFQYIINPGATNTVRNAVVLGLSSSVTF